MRVYALLLSLLLAACRSDTRPSEKSSSSDTPPTASGKGSPSKGEPEKLTSPIRDNVVSGEFKDGAALEARLFVSKLTPADSIHLALRFKLEKPLENDDPLRKSTMEMKNLVSSLKLEITSPSGPTTLETSEELGQGQLSIPWFDTELTIDGNGVSQFGKVAKWKTPAPDLLSKPGKYSIAITGSLKLSDRTIAVALKPMELEVVASGPTMKTLAELTQIGSDLVQERKSLAKPPRTSAAIIDDTDGNRWLRYQIETDGTSSHGHYDVEMVEVLLDPTGKELNYDSFLHFTCVAEGVNIETPSGPVPVEKLTVGDRVVSYDVASKTKQISTVEHVSSAHTERLIRIGDLLVTGAHPIYAGDRFELAQNLASHGEGLGVDLATRPLEPMELAQAATVYELTVSEPHTYFAGGLLVHNKAVFEPVGGQNQPWRGWFYRRAAKR